MGPMAEQSIPARAGMAVADTINEKYSSFATELHFVMSFSALPSPVG